MQAPSKALVILSGGQDSSTCLILAKHTYDEVHAITFDYGQRHRAELHAAIKVAQIVGVASHEIINLKGLLRGRSPLINLATPLETYENFESMDAIIGDRIELTFVPLRNLLFLTVAANLALAKGCFDIFTGVCAMDNANYPDCTQDFITAADFAMREALGMHRADYMAVGGPQLRIITPLIDLTKAQTVSFGALYEEWPLVMAETHTCYEGAVPPCGKCHACVLRAEGFKQANIADPLVEKWKELANRRFGQPHFGHSEE